MSDPSTSNHTPVNPRGVVTNPAIVNSAKKSKRRAAGERRAPGASQGGQNGQGGAPVHNNARREPKQQPQNAGQTPTKPKQKRRQGGPQGPQGQSQGSQGGASDASLNNILYPDMFDPQGNRSAPPAVPTPMPPQTPQKSNAFAGSSFHSAPAASSLPKPSFAGSVGAPVGAPGASAGAPGTLVSAPGGTPGPTAFGGPSQAPQAPVGSPFHASPGHAAGPYQWMPPMPPMPIPGQGMGMPQGLPSQGMPYPYYPMYNPYMPRPYFQPQPQQQPQQP